MATLRDHIFGSGTTETVFVAYQLERDRFNELQDKARDGGESVNPDILRECEYVGSRLAILHEAYRRLCEVEDKIPLVI